MKHIIKKLSLISRHMTIDHLIEIIDDYCNHNIIDSEAANFIMRILSVSNTQVRDIQTPKSKMVFFTLSTSMDEIINKIRETRHSRFIVLDNDERKPIGILLSKDLLISLLPKLNKHASLKTSSLDEFKELLHPCKVTPDSKRIDHLLREFRQEHAHMAAVINEYGAVDGLVCLEDIIEEIIGEIEDEKDPIDDRTIQEIGPNIYLVDALCEIDQVCTQLQINIEEDHFDTIGGYVSAHFDRIPKTGDQIVINDVHYKIKLADTRRVYKIEINLP